MLLLWTEMLRQNSSLKYEFVETTHCLSSSIRTTSCPPNQLTGRSLLRQAIVRVVILCLLAGGMAFGQINSPNFRYAAFNFPGAAGTEGRGINNFGEIVGFYKVGRSDCDFGITGCQIHGFKLINGKFTTINIPGTTQVKVFGVNDGGDVVGAYFTTDNHVHGFLLHHTGVLQHIDQPGSNFTSANAVNNSLTVAGNGNTGFTWRNGTFTTVDITNHAVGGESETINGLSNPGILVGDLFRADFFNGWQKGGGDLDVFQRLGGTDTHVNGVNGRDDLVGSAPGTQSGFVSFHNETEVTESSSNEALHPVKIHFPNSNGTTPWSINYNQMIVGTYFDQSFVPHGFLAVH